MKTSYSALETYKNCPLKYKYQYVERLKRPKGEAAVFGSLVHAVLQYMYKGGAVPPTKEEMVDFYSRSWKSEHYEDEKYEQLRFQEGLKMLTDFYEKHPPGEAKVVDLESRFMVKIKDKDETHILSGIVDRIDKNEDGSFEVVDYKTGKRLPSQEMVDDNMQLSIYWMALKERWPKKDPKDIKVSLYFLKHGEKISSERTEEQIVKMREEILKTIAEIEKGDFEPIPSALCDYCEYRDMCPVTRHKYGKIPGDKDLSEMVDKYIDLKDEEKGLKRKIADVGQEIARACEEKELKRIFDSGKVRSVIRNVRKTYKYDPQKVKEILEPLDKWEDVVKVDGMALRKLKVELSKDDVDRIENSKELDRESVGLLVKRK